MMRVPYTLEIRKNTMSFAKVLKKKKRRPDLNFKITGRHDSINRHKILYADIPYFRERKYEKSSNRKSAHVNMRYEKRSRKN